MTNIRLGGAKGRRSPAAPLYDEVVRLVAGLEIGDRMALADALNEEHPWESLPDRLHLLFGELLAFTRRFRP